MKSARSVKRVGAESVGGAATTRYAVVVDVAKVSEDYPGRPDLVGSHIAELPVDLWIDSAGRPVQMSYRVSTQGVTVKSIITMTRFNAPVHITAPPESEVGTS